MEAANNHRILLDQNAITSELYCFGIFKPDALSRGLRPQIEQAISVAGLAIIYRDIRHLTPDEVLRVWPAITCPHTSRTIPYMTSGPVEIFTVQGEATSQKMHNIKYSVRERYPDSNPVVTVMHTTEDDEELYRCLDYFIGSTALKSDEVV